MRLQDGFLSHLESSTALIAAIFVVGFIIITGIIIIIGDGSDANRRRRVWRWLHSSIGSELIGIISGVIFATTIDNTGLPVVAVAIRGA